MVDSMQTSLHVVETFLKGWKPFTDIPADTLLPAQILAFLAAQDTEERRTHFTAASTLYRLHQCYRDLEIFREGHNEKAERFGDILKLNVAEFAAAIAEQRQKGHLGLLQFCFEFGRHPVQPKHLLMREFLLMAFGLELGVTPVKYSAYGGGVLYSAGGKSHDEMARDFIAYGLGGSPPQAGGLLSRLAPLTFVYDVSSTAYQSGNPDQVRQGFLQWVRNTGGDAEKITMTLDTTRTDA